MDNTQKLHYLEELKQLKIKQAEQENLILKEIRDNKIYYFNRPAKNDVEAKIYKQLNIKGANPKQQKLIEAWDDNSFKYFIYYGGNRGGKCLTFNTLIETPDGEKTIGELFNNGKPFKVYAWDENKKEKVIANASIPFKKPDVHQCYRITMSDGRWVEAADHHRILMNDGNYTTVDELLKFLNVPLESNLESCLSTHVLNEKNLFERELNYRDYCSLNPHLYGGQLLGDLGNGLTYFPSPIYVQPRNYLSCNLGVLDNKYIHSLQQFFCRLSNKDVLLHYVDQSFEFLYRTFYKFLKFVGLNNQFVQKPKHEFLNQPQPIYESSQSVNFSFSPNKNDCSYNSPFYFDCNSIISYNPIGCQEVYDFTVEKYHNYFAGGLVHHNSTVGIIISLCCIHRKWLWSGKPILFPHSKPIKIRYICENWENAFEGDVLKIMEEWCAKSFKVKKEKNQQGYESKWIFEGKGEIEFLTNKQESDVMEGWEGDLVVYNEPPKRSHHIACSRGLVDRHGRELYCMTLIKEPWVGREIIRRLNPDGSPDTSVFVVKCSMYDNVGYGITKEGVENYASNLTENEKKMRIDGDTIDMFGIIYDRFNRQLHLRKPFDIPLDGIVDIAIDFHPSKEWAVSFMVTTENNFKFVFDEIWQHGSWKTIAEEIIRRIKTRHLRVGNIIMDVLSKSGGQGDLEMESVYIKMQTLFVGYGYILREASKKENDGIEMTKTLLMSQNELPSLFFFNNLKKTIEHIESYAWDDHGKPTDEDMMENLYRLVLLGTKWYPMEDEDEKKDYKKEEKRNSFTGY